MKFMPYKVRCLPYMKNWDAVSWSAYIGMHWYMNFESEAYHMNAKRNCRLHTRVNLWVRPIVRILCVTEKLS